MKNAALVTAVLWGARAALAQTITKQTQMIAFGKGLTVALCL